MSSKPIECPVTKFTILDDQKKILSETTSEKFSIKAFNPLLVNPTASSQFDIYNPLRAIDGDYDTGYESESHFNSVPEWWRAEFVNKATKVSQVQIMTSNGDLSFKSLSGAKVFIGETLCGTLP